MKIYIDRSYLKKFIDRIKETREGFLVSSCIEKNNTLEFLFKEKGVVGCITFYFNKNGYTTCVASNKNKIVEGEILKLLLKDSHTYAKFEDLKSFTLTLSLKNNNLEDIKLFLQKISRNYTLSANGYSFTSKYGESIYLVEYGEKFVLQGKAGYLLAQLLPYIQSKIDIKDEEINSLYINGLTKTRSVVISDFENELKTKLTIAYPLINSHIRSIMLPSLILINEGIDIPDYCAYIFPVYRGLEGCLRQLLQRCNIHVDKSFGCFAPSKQNNKFELKTKGSYTQDEKKALENLYNYFKNKRNPIFHTDNDLETSTTIEDRLVARSHIYDTLDIIEQTFSQFNL